MWIRRSAFAKPSPTEGFKTLSETLRVTQFKTISFFYIIPVEKFLRPSTEVDVSLHVPAYRRVEKPLAGLPEGLRGEPDR